MSKVRKYVSSFSINLHIATEDTLLSVSTSGALYPIQKSGTAKKKSFHHFCPVCGIGAPSRMRQQMVCEVDPSHGPFQSDETLRGQDVNGEVVLAELDAIEEAKRTELPENTLHLNVHRFADVTANTYPLGTAYIFLPERDDDSYQILNGLVQQHYGKYAFCGTCAIRKSEKFVGLVPWGDGLVIQQFTFPEELNVMEVPASRLEGEIALRMGKVLDSIAQDWDSEQYRDMTAERIAEMLQSQDDAAAPKRTTKAPAESGPSLMDQLAAMVDKAKVS